MPTPIRSAATTGRRGTPLVRKLGYRPGIVAAHRDAPDGFPELLDGLPDGVTVCAIDTTWSRHQLVVRKELR